MELKLPYAWSPRSYQLSTWNHFVPHFEEKRAVAIAHRRWGKDLLGIQLASVASQQRLGTYWHVLPYALQGRAVVWNGIDTMNNRKFLDYFHPKQIESKHENEMRVRMVNGSIWQVIGGDDIDRHVGTNPVGVVLSEYALMDPRVWDYIRPILRENRGWLFIITTIRGKNHAYKAAKRAEKLMAEGNKNWFYLNQTIDDTGAVTKEQIDQDREEGMSEELIRQEYYNDADQAIEGAYYAKELKKAREDGRICTIPYDPKLPVNTYWDIGFGDFTVIVFEQMYGFERRIIDCYANSGEAIPHYARILKEKGYTYGEHYGPWDVEIKQLAAGGKSVWDVARELGIRFRVTPQPARVEDGIEQVRNIFPSLWFDGAKCERLLEALGTYRKEPLAIKLQPTGENAEKAYKDKPLHDWSSHFCDAVRVMAWNTKKRSKWGDHKPQDKAVDNFQYV